MKIKLILPATITVLALMQLGVNGHSAYEALQHRKEAAAFVEVSDATSLLLTSAGEWAQERGLSNAALRAKDPASETTRGDIAKHREAGDKAWASRMPRSRSSHVKAGNKYTQKKHMENITKAVAIIERSSALWGMANRFSSSLIRFGIEE